MFKYLFRGLLGGLLTRGYGTLKPLRESFIALAYLTMQYQAQVNISLHYRLQSLLKQSISKQAIVYEVGKFIRPVFMVLRRLYQLTIKQDSSFIAHSYLTTSRENKVGIKQNQAVVRRLYLRQAFSRKSMLKLGFSHVSTLKTDERHNIILEVRYGG